MATKAYYKTKLGSAFLGDALDLVESVPDSSINLIVTSPPFPLTFQKKRPYGTVDIAEFVPWFVRLSKSLRRVLTDDGSLVIDIGGVWNKGTPTKNIYQYRLLVALCDEVGFHLAQDVYWYNPAALPAPAEWVTVRRIRIKGAVNQVWWLSKTEWPKADNRNVLQEYSKDMLRLIKRGYRSKARPSGHNITTKFGRDLGGSIPPNLLRMGNNDSNGAYLKHCNACGHPVHPARFPRGLPEFFIQLCTNAGDVVLDPFAGSNVTGEAAERLNRRWIAYELSEDYLRGSQVRFEAPSRAEKSGARQKLLEPLSDS